VFYLDPPYYQTAGYRYKVGIEDYQRLAEILAAIEGKFILTINDHEVMRDVFSGFRIDEVEVGYSISRKVEARRKFGELVIRNYG